MNTTLRNPSVLLCLAILGTSTAAQARDVEPGAMSVGAAVGAGIRMGGAIEGSSVFLTQIQGEYALSKMIGLVADLGLGLGSAVPLRLHLGAKGRWPDLDWPITPYAQLQFTVGQLFGSIGANLWVLGARLGVGADYPLTAQWGVGALLAADLGSTLGVAPRFYGTFDILVCGTYTF